MKISIITATYNSAETVRDTLESVKIQTYKNIEHVIIDGVSKDNTLDIVNSYEHISHIESGKDQGIYDAMNKGIKASTGDIIGILNSDDFYSDDEVIQKVADAFEKEDIDAVYGDLIYFNGDDPSNIKRFWKSGDYKKSKFINGWMPPHPTFFVKKSVYERFGNFNLSLGSAADYEFMLRVMYKEGIRVGYIPNVLVNMRDGGVSNASLKNRIQANRMDQKAWKINNLKPRFYTFALKPLRKIKQFFIKK